MNPRPHDPPRSEFDGLLDALTTRQYLAPHEPVARTLAGTVDCLHVCPEAIQQALRWLHLDGSRAIGRLRRTELMQLARAVYRFWRQPESSAPAPR